MKLFAMSYATFLLGKLRLLTADRFSSDCLVSYAHWILCVVFTLTCYMKLKCPDCWLI